MKRFCAVMLCAVAVMMQTGHAQDKKNVTDIITEIEGSLKTVTAKEAAAQKRDAASVKEQVDHLKSMIAARTEPSDTPQPAAASADRKAAESKSADAKSAADLSSLALHLSTYLSELKKTVEEEKALQASLKAQASPAVAVSGLVYTYYTYSVDGTDGRDANRFDFERIYLTAKSQLSEGAKFQLTTDVYRNSAAGSYYSGLGIRLKFGFLDLALSNPLSLRFGMIPTQWASFIDQYWKYRGVAMTIVDRQSLFSSADLGASLTYALPAKYGELSAYVLNGSGYTNPETNRFKDYAVRLNVTPFPELPELRALTVAGYAYKGANMSAMSTALKRDRVGGMLSYAYGIASATAEYHIRHDAVTSPDTVTKGTALSVFGEVKAPLESIQNKLSMVWRYDLVDPNTDQGADLQRFGILGLSYKVTEKINFIADYQQALGESSIYKRPDGTKTDVDKRLFLHLIIAY